MNFVSFYTLNTRYETVVKRLIESAKEFNIIPYVEGVENRGTWVENCGIKPEFILKCHDMFDGPFTWVDADAMFHAEPTLLDTIDADLGAHYHKKVELLTGTLYVGNTAKSREVCKEWVKRQKEEPRNWDQRTLQAIVEEDDSIRFHKLPRSYTAIFDQSYKDGVIVHYQESRNGHHGIEELKDVSVEKVEAINILRTRTEIEADLMTNCNRNPGVRIQKNGNIELVRPSAKTTEYMLKHYRQVNGDRIWAVIDK